MEKNALTELVQKAQQGDRTAMNDLIGEYYPRLYAAAYQTVKDPDTACDVTQEACLEIMSSIDKLENPAAFSVWAQKIAYHQCSRHFRKHREVLVEENEDGETVFDRLPDESEQAQIDAAYETKEFQQEMMAMIDTLPPEQRSALLLHYYERLSVKEIAQIQDTTEGTVKSRLNYGRKAVKKQVEAYEKKNGIRLHSVAPIGLLLWKLFSSQQAGTANLSLPSMPKVAKALASTTGKSAAASATSASAGVAAPKVVAGLVAAALAAGAIGGGLALRNREPAEPLPSTQHQHSYGIWQRDENYHWRVCSCEEQEMQLHVFEDRECFCGQYLPSEGLSIHTSEGVAYIYRRNLCSDAVVVIPQQQDGFPVIGIEARAFWQDDEISKAVIPGSVEDMGSHVFAYSSIREAVFLPGSQLIGDCMFYGCEQLEIVTVAETVQSIGEDAFFGCSRLRQIRFGGTMAQWQAMMPEQGSYQVICSDGTIPGVE